MEKPVSIINESEFIFLNKKAKLKFPFGWNDKEEELLWLYNLHYFDGLINNSPPKSIKIKLIDEWVNSNKNTQSIGWQSYPLSLRIVNWIKFFWSHHIEEERFQYSLCQQVRYLVKNIEYHLLGNHVLENARALIFSGCYFSGLEADAWLNKGLSILEKELNEQILNDGGHFELSPMYHSIMIELLFDIYLLSNEKDSPKELQMMKEKISEYISKMASWLSGMIHPDMEISFFNDCAPGIAQRPETLLLNITDIGISWDNLKEKDFVHFANSGYMRCIKGDATLFFDVAKVGASYQSGHGHADTLSIEMSIDEDRVFTNLGTSQYGARSRRDFERSTAAHSTLEIEGKDSSETWGGFRVGRRANCKNLEINRDKDTLILSATHDGYTFLKGSPIHKRSIFITNKLLIIEDELSKTGLDAIIRYHIHPENSISIDSESKKGVIMTKKGKAIEWRIDAENIFIEENKFAPSFGVLIPCKTICLSIKNNNKASMRIDLA